MENDELENLGNYNLKNGMPKELQGVADWIPMKRYMEWFGETKPAIENRIRTKIWKPRKQWARPTGGGIWISIKGVNEWAEKHDPRTKEQSLL